MRSLWKYFLLQSTPKMKPFEYLVLCAQHRRGCWRVVVSETHNPLLTKHLVHILCSEQNIFSKNY